MSEKKKRRCCWVDSCTEKYHDEEWGVPVYDDNLLFEMLVLESFQAGLSWVIVFKKREGFREAFNCFDPQVIVNYSEDKVEQLLNNDNIIKNKAKILATTNNARVFLKIQEEFGSFSNYLWGFVNNKVIKITDNHLPESDLANKVSKNMKKRGIKFMGPVTTYAYLQAIGVVNNHDSFCYKAKE